MATGGNTTWRSTSRLSKPASNRKYSERRASTKSSRSSSTKHHQQHAIRATSDSHPASPNSQNTTKSIRLSDLMAAMYPGIKIGHKYCVQKPIFVPKTMGWLWNTEDTTTGVPFPRGWRPGAIAMGVRKRFMRPRSTSEPLNAPTGTKGKKIRKRLKTESSTASHITKNSAIYDEEKIPPTLHIRKEHGVYQVMMRPIKKKDQNVDQKNEDGVEEERPVQFKIVESSTSSRSQISKSSSSLKIEYVCTGALRKPIIKPEVAEMGTQWEDAQKVKEEDTDSKKDSNKKKKRKNSDPKLMKE